MRKEAAMCTLQARRGKCVAGKCSLARGRESLTESASFASAMPTLSHVLLSQLATEEKRDGKRR